MPAACAPFQDHIQQSQKQREELAQEEVPCQSLLARRAGFASGVGRAATYPGTLWHILFPGRRPFPMTSGREHGHRQILLVDKFCQTVGQNLLGVSICSRQCCCCCCCCCRHHWWSSADDVSCLVCALHLRTEPADWRPGSSSART